MLEALRSYLGNLARVGAIELLGDGERPARRAVGGGGRNRRDVRRAAARRSTRPRCASALERELGKVDKELQGVETKLGRADFVDKAPAEIVDKEREKAAALRDRRAVLEGHLASLRAELRRPWTSLRFPPSSR